MKEKKSYSIQDYLSDLARHKVTGVEPDIPKEVHRTFLGHMLLPSTGMLEYFADEVKRFEREQAEDAS